MAVLATGTLSAGLGCAASGVSACTQTPFISPTTVTLDHAIAGNSQLFTTGVKYSGSNCVEPLTNVATAVGPAYTWNVSDTVDATIINPYATSATISCTNAALNTITVYTTLATFTSPTSPPVSIPSGLPSATLVCK